MIAKSYRDIIIKYQHFFMGHEVPDDDRVAWFADYLTT